MKETANKWLSLTMGDLWHWMLDNYPNHMEHGSINVNALELALAEHFSAKPNPMLHELVVKFCLDLQDALLQQNLETTKPTQSNS